MRSSAVSPPRLESVSREPPALEDDRRTASSGDGRPRRRRSTGNPGPLQSPAPGRRLDPGQSARPMWAAGDPLPGRLLYLTIMGTKW